ncbi:MAG: CopD family protein [Alphaproteobacteria bacterium]
MSLVLWLKILHVGAISLWCAGLIGLPVLYLQRTHVSDRDALYRLQQLVRFFYVSLISPAAFVAIASGIGLIFAAGVFTSWFAAKLFLVGGLVIVHILLGLVVIRLFDDDQVYPVWRFLGMTGLTLPLVGAILGVVLLKPHIGEEIFPAVMAEPGGLRRIAETFIAWIRP